MPHPLSRSPRVAPPTAGLVAQGKVKPVLVKWLFMQKIDRMAQRARQFSPPQAL
jgi:hypothetical protein